MKNFVIFTMTLLALTGCATQLRNIKSSIDIKKTNEQSIVFGRLNVAKAWLKTAYVLKIKNIHTSQEFEYAMKNWGCPKNNDCHNQPFCFLLPPGLYKISQI